MRRLIFLILIVGLLAYLVFASNAFQVQTSTEIRDGIGYRVHRFEWHWGNLISYIKDLPEIIQTRIRYLINNLKQKLS